MRTSPSVRGLSALVCAIAATVAFADTPAQTSVGLRIGATVSDMPGFLALPVQADFGAGSGTVDASGRVVGSVSSVIAGLNSPATAKNVYLVSQGKVIAIGGTDAAGRFEVTANRAGSFTLFVGPFSASGKTSKLVRSDAADSVLTAVKLQVPAGGAVTSRVVLTKEYDPAVTFSNSNSPPLPVTARATIEPCWTR